MGYLGVQANLNKLLTLGSVQKYLHCFNGLYTPFGSPVIGGQKRLIAVLQFACQKYKHLQCDCFGLEILILNVSELQIPTNNLMTVSLSVRGTCGNCGRDISRNLPCRRGG